MSDHNALRSEIETRQRAAAPLTKDSALAIALLVLKDFPKEAAQYTEWFGANGDFLIARLNG